MSEESFKRTFGEHRLKNISKPVLLGGIVIGFSTEISTGFISTAYKPAVAFVIMVIMLLFRPTGLIRSK